MKLKVRKATMNFQKRAGVVFIERFSRVVRDERGQDLIEYALMAATIAVAVGAIFPQSIAPNISTIFSKVSSSLGSAGGI
jgi:Flp pilus assembly pilin Flp